MKRERQEFIIEKLHKRNESIDMLEILEAIALKYPSCYRKVARDHLNMETKDRL